ncbi:MAG: lysine--tRNA ligase [Capsulimonadaceae bacterium]|nr:lysine--tRNA ligase [Capsulimonadaceae bacterium]
MDPVRLRKLAELRAEGRDPFAIERFDRTHACAQVIEQYEHLADTDVSVAGRITCVRIMGKAAFLDVTDQTGRLQIYVRRDDLGEEIYNDIRHRADLGDFLGVTGFVFTTRTGEISLHAKSIVILAKALRNLPIGKEYETSEGEEKVSGGLRDTEQRYRQRYVDLLANKESRETILRRIKMTRAIRDFLDADGFLEVETPVLQTVAGGAAARPFLTHHNALDLELHLRISLELYLKRLIVGGLEKVYEIGRVFRNEGVSTRHNPEFSLLELYQAYTDLDGMMDLTERLFRAACVAVNGSEQFDYLGNRIDLAPAFERLPMLEGIRRNAGIEPSAFVDLASAHDALRSVGLPTENEPTVGGIIEKLHERFTQPTLIQPTFITDFPLETSPLAKKRQDNPSLVRRFEIYAGGAELGNAFSEINDPLDQRERFESQGRLRAAGDAEAHPMDEDFLRALEYGMPPTGGFGFGIDRLAIMLSGAKSIRDVILFPLLRPE